MAFIRIATLDEGHVTVSVPSIYRIRPSLPVAEMPDATKVEFGLDRQYTREDVHALAARVEELGGDLVRLSSPSGEPVYLAEPAISSIRPADPAQDAPEACSVLIVSGRRQAVRETPAEVEVQLGLD